MNRTIKEATVNRYHYETHDQLRQHLADFVTAYCLPSGIVRQKGRVEEGRISGSS
jgi:hypothetical protein